LTHSKLPEFMLCLKLRCVYGCCACGFFQPSRAP
jgi:hypothetical protein